MYVDSLFFRKVGKATQASPQSLLGYGPILFLTMLLADAFCRSGCLFIYQQREVLDMAHTFCCCMLQEVASQKTLTANASSTAMAG